MINLITETELSDSIINAARDLGWLAYHSHRSERSEPGYPDLTLVRPPRVIFAELKVGKGRLTRPRLNKGKTRLLPGQTTWKAALELCPGVEYYLWMPEDLDAIYEVLK